MKNREQSKEECNSESTSTFPQSYLSKIYNFKIPYLDKMIDLGFEEDVNFILDKIPSTNLKSEDESTAEI